MQPEASPKQRLKEALSEEQRARFSDLHGEFYEALRTRGKSGDPAKARDALRLYMDLLAQLARDIAESQQRVVTMVEADLELQEQEEGAADLDTRLAQADADTHTQRDALEEAFARYRAIATELVLTVEGALDQFARLREPHAEMERARMGVLRATAQRSLLRLQRDRLVAERRMVARQHTEAEHAQERLQAIAQYRVYFEATYTDEMVARALQPRKARDETHKEGREEAPRVRKRPRTLALELLSAPLCLYQEGAHQFKFILPDDRLLRLYSRLAKNETTRSGFAPLKRAQRVEAEQAQRLALCPELSEGAYLLETEGVRLFDGAPLKHVERFCLLYELVYYQQQAATLLNGFHYGARDATHLCWIARPQSRHYDKLVCASHRGVIMLDLSYARVGAGSLYLEDDDYVLFTELARAQPVPNFTHKLLALLAAHQRLAYGELLRALATYWSERAFLT